MSENSMRCLCIYSEKYFMLTAHTNLCSFAQLWRQTMFLMFFHFNHKNWKSVEYWVFLLGDFTPNILLSFYVPTLYDAICFTSEPCP